MNNIKELPNNVHTLNLLLSIYDKNSMSKKLTTSEFITKAQNIHGKKYDYSLVQYINNNSKVKIICHTHGEFEQRPNDHISKKSGCYKCAGHGKNNCEFINSCTLIHNNKYDYSKTFYNGIDNKIIVICKKHGEFSQTAYSHVNGNGCSKCRSDYMSIIQTLSTKEFIERAIKVHGAKYDYSLVNYVSSKNKVEIKCKKHGSFYQQAQSHLQSKGCPKCKESHGETKIRLFLEQKNISYEYQKKFDNCINDITDRKLPFDFYLKNYNLCIEFNGKQHYTINHGYFGANKIKAEKSFNKLKFNDELKKNYCTKNNINLLVIKFNENIEEKIIEKINSFNELRN